MELKKARRCLDKEPRCSPIPGVVDQSLAEADTHIDTASALVLHITPKKELAGLMPSVAELVKAYLPTDDERRRKVEIIAWEVCRDPNKAKFSRKQRATIADAVVAAYRVLEDRRIRTSNFVQSLLHWAVGLTFAAALIAAFGIVAKDLAPLCFSPDDTHDVCPTKNTERTERTERTEGTEPNEGTEPTQKFSNFIDLTSPWDYAIVEALGTLGAAVTAVAAFRRLDGSPTPYHVPSTLAILKLPFGALAAVLGLLLIKGEIFPGLSDLDSSAQILAWAVIFGAAQQLFTHLVDHHGKALMSSISGPYTMFPGRSGRLDDPSEQV
ncbi:hypothetical protein ACTWP5_17575 [Streptomyces sp. 4N509B]|uniref:hypothetical protein n=1 Tax=Streptomyces sp. 4N509B TaxID=3457413 RepID=UPI003FD20352